jgi:hypothetical protein
MDFCESRGGSLVDESNPALQGFLSWELWRRHKGDANGQYWMGAVRDKADPKNWKWIDGKPVSVSFWNLPGGNDNCARFDGTKGWLWSDTNCGLNLNFICQHRKSRTLFYLKSTLLVIYIMNFVIRWNKQFLVFYNNL